MTTDLGFAHDVCDDAALYYRPRNAPAAADCILRLIDDQSLWEKQIARGKDVLTRYPTPHERYQQYIRLLLSICQREGASGRGTITFSTTGSSAVGERWDERLRIKAQIDRRRARF